MKTKDERITILAILDDWQNACWNTAKTGKPFVVEEVDSQVYEPLCQAICNAYHYQFEAFGRRVLFNPQPEASAA